MTHSEDDSSPPAGPHFLLVGLALIATPLAWALRLVTNFSLDNGYCFSGANRLEGAPQGAGWLWPLLLAIDLVGIAIACGTIALAFRSWKATPPGKASPDPGSARQGRTRFLSLWGMFIGIGFLIATLYDVVAVIVIPICG